MPDNNKATLLSLFGIILLVACIYYPVLDSPFYMDDFAHLTRLGFVESDGYLNFILGVEEFPGRPVSMLTFAIQHEAWPDNPFAFKFVNLLLHLGNGVLIFLVSTLLMRRLAGNTKETNIAGLLIAGLWLLHPLHLTTTLYVIQRMTLLTTFFVLTGVTVYLLGRESYFKSPSRYKVFLIIMGVFTCMILAVLSKESGILLAVFILVIEATLFSREAISKDFRTCLWIISGIPLLALGIYITVTLDNLLFSYQFRDFSMSERLMTQARVLFVYVGQIFLPRIGEFTPYYDHFVISKSLLAPVTTLVSVIGIIAVVAGSISFRKIVPVVSFSVLWFLGGHLLESTIMNLEMYFEHRNYLPSYGLLFGAVCLAIYCWKLIRNRRLATLVVGSPFVLIMLVTVFEVDLWRQPLLQIHKLVDKHPESPRTLNRLGNMYLSTDYFDLNKATAIYERYAELFPNDVYPYIRILHIDACLKGKSYSEEEWEELYALAGDSKQEGYNVLTELDGIVTDLNKDRCEDLDISKFAYLILTLMQNPDFNNQRHFFHEFLASLAIQSRDIISAILNISEAIRLQAKPARFITKIDLLLAAGDTENAGLALQQFEDYLEDHPKYYLGYIDDYQRLENELVSFSEERTNPAESD